jgi:hypothetical protein
MIKSEVLINKVKAYLNQNAFAGPNFPNESCSVPEFDFSEIRGVTVPVSEESLSEKVNNIRTEIQSKGYEVVDETQNQITFRGKDGAIVIVDLDTGNISMDTTGMFLSKKVNN